MGLSVVLLSYQEAENLRVLLPQIIHNVRQCGEAYEVIVVDVNPSLDNTEEVCKEFGVDYYLQEEPCFGGAFRTAIKYAKKDKFLIMDSDGSHDPKYIPDIYHKFVEENNDVVIGSRYVKGGKTNDELSSQIMSKVLNTVFRISLGIKANDISTDYRMYKTAYLKQVKLTCNNYDVLQEVLLKMKIKKPSLMIGEVPISFKKRIMGESKRQLIKFVLSYIVTLCRLVRLRIYMEHRRNK